MNENKLVIYIICDDESLDWDIEDILKKCFPISKFKHIMVKTKDDKAKLLIELSQSSHKENLILYAGMQFTNPILVTSKLRDKKCLEDDINKLLDFIDIDKEINVNKFQKFAGCYLEDVTDTSNIITPDIKPDDFIKKYSSLINDDKWRSIGRVNPNQIRAKIGEILNNDEYPIKIVTFFINEKQKDDIIEYIEKFKSCDYVEHILFGPKIENIDREHVSSFGKHDVKYDDVTDYLGAVGFKNDDLPCSILIRYGYGEYVLKCTNFDKNEVPSLWIEFATDKYVVDVDSTILQLFKQRKSNAIRTLSYDSEIKLQYKKYDTEFAMEISKLVDSKRKWLFVYIEYTDDEFTTFQRKFIKGVIERKKDIGIAKVVSIGCCDWNIVYEYLCHLTYCIVFSVLLMYRR